MLIILVLVILLTEAFSLFVEYLNYRNWTTAIPKQLKGFIDAEKYKQAQKYNKAGQHLDFISSIFSTLVTLVVLTLGILGRLDSYITHNITQNETLVVLIFFGIIYLINDLLTLPFDIYQTFVIEERFGFNKTTVKTFVIDKIKNYLLIGIIGSVVLSLFKFYYDFTGSYFWFYAWITVTLISLFFSIFYTNLIVPIFNKLTPLKNGNLKEAIEKYASKVNFPLDKIMVMDASKRSSKGNAFFNGLFGKKNIVLYDTIIEKHTVNELVAILAHEVGHFKHRHVMKLILMGILQTAVTFFILGILINRPEFSIALGSNEQKMHLGLIAFMLIFTPVNILSGILGNIISRKFEFEADNYSKTTFSGSELSKALKKLSIDNLSNLKPHPLYVFINYSHPPVLKRLTKLESGKERE